MLHVAEEGAGRVSYITREGGTVTVLDSIDCPEGLCFDADGNLYITEDTDRGSVLRLTPGGIVTRVTDATAPEGVAIAPDGSLYFTESTVQLVSNPLDLWTAVSRMSEGSGTEQACLMRYALSFSGIAIDRDGIVYTANELSLEGSGPSILVLDPGAAPRMSCVRNRVSVRACRSIRAVSFHCSLHRREWEGRGESSGRSLPMDQLPFWHPDSRAWKT